MKIGLIGSTGNIGKYLLSSLILQNEHELYLITRSKRSKFESIQNIKQEISGSIEDDETLIKLINKENALDLLFLCLPQAFDHEQMLNVGKKIGDLCKLNDINTIIRISSFGIDNNSVKFDSSNTQGLLGDAHVAIETYYTNELGLETHSVRPTSFFTNLLYNLEELEQTSWSSISTPLSNSKEAIVNWVSCKDIAGVTNKIIQNINNSTYSSNSSNSNPLLHVYDVMGGAENTLSADDICKLIDTVKKEKESTIFSTLSSSSSNSSNNSSNNSTGESKCKYNYVSPPPVEAYEQLWSFLQKGGFNCNSNFNSSGSGNTVKEMTGQVPASLKTYIAELMK